MVEVVVFRCWKEYYGLMVDGRVLIMRVERDIERK